MLPEEYSEFLYWQGLLRLLYKISYIGAKDIVEDILTSISVSLWSQ